MLSDIMHGLRVFVTHASTSFYWVEVTVASIKPILTKTIYVLWFVEQGYR